jgi:hypothetical protein
MSSECPAAEAVKAETRTLSVLASLDDRKPSGTQISASGFTPIGKKKNDL